MNTVTKIIGWIVLLITEFLIVFAFITNPADRSALIGYQIIIFCTVWTAVGVKNAIDLKRDVAELTSKGV
jgi:hypothetical protein